MRFRYNFKKQESVSKSILERSLIDLHEQICKPGILSVLLKNVFTHTQTKNNINGRHNCFQINLLLV